MPFVHQNRNLSGAIGGAVMARIHFLFFYVFVFIAQFGLRFKRNMAGERGRCQKQKCEKDANNNQADEFFAHARIRRNGEYKVTVWLV